MSPPTYELIDFGDGKKLERFGRYLVNRPSPAATGTAVSQPDAWQRADAIYQKRGSSHRWSGPEDAADWQVTIQDVTFQLRATESGQVGIFPEQRSNWKWIATKVRSANRPIKVLNLFGYTGGSTLVAAAAGAAVVHVDAAKNAVGWAKENAALSGLKEAPIRWIVEDAPTFVQREGRRGNTYDAIILDPPSYGHGPKGEPFKIKEDLLPLLEHCGQIWGPNRSFFLLTCHSPGYGPAELEACLSDAVFGACQSGGRAQRMNLSTADGRMLNAGCSARWPG